MRMNEGNRAEVSVCAFFFVWIVSNAFSQLTLVFFFQYFFFCLYKCLPVSSGTLPDVLYIMCFFFFRVSLNFVIFRFSFFFFKEE